MKPRLTGVDGATSFPGIKLADQLILPDASAVYAGHARQVGGVWYVCDGSIWRPIGQSITHLTFISREDPTTAASNWVWTNMPASATALYGGNTHYAVRRIDLTYATQVRFYIDVATGGASGAKLYLRYSTDHLAFSDLTGASCTFGTGTGDFTSGWVDLLDAAKGDVWIQVWGSGGDGAADPRFFTIQAQFR
jgi:hypothetical protein